MDFVALYCEPWHTPLRTSKHHYIRRLARDGHRVLYVEVPANPINAVLRWGEFANVTLPLLKKGIEQVEHNVWTMAGLVPFPYHPAAGKLFDNTFINHMNQLVNVRLINSVLNKLSFQAPVVIVYYPFIAPVIRKFTPSKVIFHIVDEWQSMAGIPSSMRELTAAMLANSDATVVTSARLYRRYESGAKKIRLLRHGTDLSLFAPVARGEVEPDARIVRLSGLKVGYYGALHKIDFDLVRHVAQQKGDWKFIFIGPMRSGQGVTISRDLPDNVILVDSLPREMLPKFLAAIDVFWMPFVVNELTHSMCPIKIYEVLSAGVPLVSSDLEESREIAGGFCYFATGVAGHILQLETASASSCGDQRERHLSFASQYDWDLRYRDFIDIIRE